MCSYAYTSAYGDKINENKRLQQKIFTIPNIIFLVFDFLFCIMNMIAWMNLCKFNFVQECYCKCCNKIDQKIDNNIINNMEINFDISTKGKIKVIAPSSMKIKNFFDFVFEIMNVEESNRNKIIFLFGGKKFDINTDNSLENEFKNNNPIVVMDIDEIITLNNELFIIK